MNQRDMSIFTVHSDGSIEERQTRPRGQRMGVASWIQQARREARQERIAVAFYLFGIAYCIAGLIAIISICTSVALGS